MERFEDKKRRLARIYDLLPLAKARKVEPIKRADGTYCIRRGEICAPYVGPLALGKCIRISGYEDLVPLRWDEKSGSYGVIADENAMDGNIVEFTLIYGKDKT